MNFWKRTFATLAAFAILLGAVPELPAPLAAPVFAADEDTEAVGPNDKTAFLVTLADGKTEETWSFNDVRRGWRQEERFGGNLHQGGTTEKYRGKRKRTEGARN